MKKILLYVMMLSSIIYFSACGNKEKPIENEPESIEHSAECTHDDDHNHDHSDGNEHKHDAEHTHDHEGECTEGNDHNHDHDGHSNEQLQKEVDDHSNVIMFSDEQAKNILDFKVETIKRQTFYQILKTSGQILSAPGDEVQISATMNGIVTISSSNLVEGFSVKAGQQLFSISGRNLSENNSSSRLIEAKIVFENAKSEFDRAQQLVNEKIISQKEFQQAQLAFEQAKVNYQTLSAGMSGGGKSISTPMTGFIKNLYVQSGQYVDIGQTLATVTQNKRLILRADVSQRYLPNIKGIHSASFTTPYDNKTYDLNELGGRLLSIGRNSGENSYYTPVNFEFDNKGNIIEGSFVEVYLKSQPISNALVVPITALIEEQGHFFVFVKLDHEGEYIKKEVSIGASDGIHRQILAGLAGGEKIVTNGAFGLKLASMGSAMPEHSHSH